MHYSVTIILLKWHKIHDNGLYSFHALSSVIHRQSLLPLFGTVQDHARTQRSALGKDQSETPHCNSILIFPRERGFSGLGRALDPARAARRPLGRTQRTPPQPPVTRNGERTAEHTDLIPQHQWMTFEQREAGWIYILLQKKKKKKGKYIHEGKMGWTILGTQASSVCTPRRQLPRGSRAPASCHTLAHNRNRILDQGNICKVEAQMEIVRYTQCKFIVHSIFF